MYRLTVFVLLSFVVGVPAVEAVEESAVLAWSEAGEEVGATLACWGDGAVFGAPGSGGAGDRFFLGIFDPQTGLWANVDEAGGGTSFVELAMSGTNVAAVLDDAVTTYGWDVGGLTELEIVTGTSPRAVAIDNNATTPLLAIGKHYGGFPVYFGLVSVYSHDASTWVWEDTFQNPITFGWTLSMDGNRIAVGQRGSSEATGEVRFIVRSQDEPYSWSLSGPTLTAPDGEISNLFGAAVALDGKSLAVGSPLDDNAGGVDAGSVHMFQAGCSNSSYVADQVLYSPNPVAGGRFGASVTLVGRDLVVGEPGADAPGHPSAGAAHLYRRGLGGWVLVETLTRFTPGSGDELGASVCISNHGVLVGAPFADQNGIDSGVVLFYAGLTTLFADGFECGNFGPWVPS